MMIVYISLSMKPIPALHSPLPVSNPQPINSAPRTLSHAPSLMAVLEEAPKAFLPSLLLITSLPPKFSFL